MEVFLNADRSFKIACDNLLSNNGSTDIKKNLIIESSYNTIDFSGISIIFNGHVDFSKGSYRSIDIYNVSEITTTFLTINSITLPENVKISYNSVNDGYIRNTSIGYNPIDRTIGRSDAYFTYINVSGDDSTFNNSLYVNKNLLVHKIVNISNSLLINGMDFSLIETSFNNIRNAIARSFYSDKILTRDATTTNVSISNNLYVLKTAYFNDISINGQLLINVLKVPGLFTIDPSGHGNESGTLIINGDLIVNGTQTSIASSNIDISDLAITLASKLSNIQALSNSNAGLDISNIASLKYNGTTWNFSGGLLHIDNKQVLLNNDLSLAKRNFDLSLISIITDFSSSFFRLKRNIDNSYNDTYTQSQITSSFILRSAFDLSWLALKSYTDNSYISKSTFDSSLGAIRTLMDTSYVVQRRVGAPNSFDSSYNSFTEKLDMSYVLNSVFEASHNSLKQKFDISFATIKVTNIEASGIIIETINTPLVNGINKPLSFVPSITTINTTISGDLIVTGKAILKSFRISNRHNFDVSINGYSSHYLATSDISASIVDYYSNVGSIYNKVFKIDACGNVTNYTGVYGAVSDSRLKENIVNCSPKLEDLLKVRVVNYNLKGPDSSKYIGVVAQELEELFPELVAETNTHERFKTVNYSNLTILLIKAFQEQQILINNLNTSLEELENSV
jgi:hypothetical protein